MPKYQNSNTGDIVEYNRPSPRLEMLPNWTRLDPELSVDPVERPTRGASKDAWQAYARTQVDVGEEAAIDGLTKEQLIEQYGSDH
jgi:hypothetical protein